MDPSKRDFHHPYEPYDIQLQFMNALYDCVEDGKVGIFESPTGTVSQSFDLLFSDIYDESAQRWLGACPERCGSFGKSLSLICGSLTWLRDHKTRSLEEQLQSIVQDEDEPEWMLEHARKQKRKAFLDQTRELEARLTKIRAKEQRQRLRLKNGEPHSKRVKVEKDSRIAEESDEARFLLDDYESDSGNELEKQASCGTHGSFSAATQELMKKLQMVPGAPQHDEEKTEDELKIFYCSRTHSQLSQFINELRRVNPSPITMDEVPAPSEQSSALEVARDGNLKHLTLGSRRNLCVNPKVASLKNATAINEKCLELQRPGTPAEHKCPYLPTKENEPLVNDFRDHVLASIRDIEDLPDLGKRLGICPYYASRPTIKPSEIVTLPYPLLLQKSSREALGLSLKGHIVIIDEAHNLMDTISSLHSITISLHQLKRSRAQLGVYLQKFRTRLKGKNRVYVTQLVRLLDSLAAYLQQHAKERGSLVKAVDLLAGKGVDQINLYKLIHYLQESKLARKVDGYLVDVAERAKKDASAGNGQPNRDYTETSIPVLTHIQGFLSILADPEAEGRFFFERSEDDGDVKLKYMLLDPTYHFREVVQDARAVILAGGTMSPMSDYISRLFSYLPSERLTTLSCGHVIPAENLMAWPVMAGPNGTEYDFTFAQRNSTTMIDDLGAGLLRICHAIPDGVVVFFPSYAYLDQVAQRWQVRTTAPKSIWDLLAETKAISRESKGNTSVEAILQQYSSAIDKGDGGLLLSVVGGKMSEGINFSDKLGRAVVVVGLPYPNIHSPEWEAKIARAEKAVVDRGGSVADAKATGRDLYENSCMRAVNQSIGRAIRHQNDYASILLLDRRYSSNRIKEKLPGWIRQGLRQSTTREPFAEMVDSLKAFFKAKEVS